MTDLSDRYLMAWLMFAVSIVSVVSVFTIGGWLLATSYGAIVCLFESWMAREVFVEE